MRNGFAVTVVVFLLSATLPAQVFIDVDGGGITYTTASGETENLHDIWLEDFRIAATETTVAQWRKFTISTSLDFCWVNHYCGDISDLSPEENCPIQLVRIEEAAAYCNWRSLREGLEPVYYLSEGRILRDIHAEGYRLPTTEEWDYAARGGRLSHGYIYAGSDNPDEVAWYGKSVDEGTRPVRRKNPNELGIYDMSGNIREWTWPDIGIPSPTSGMRESVNIRGGNWTSDRGGISLVSDEDAWVFQWNCIGFRLARNAE